MFNTPLALNDAQACIVYMPEGVHEINATVKKVGGKEDFLTSSMRHLGLWDERLQ